MSLVKFALHYVLISLRYRRNVYLRTMLLRDLSEEMFNHWNYEAENFTGKYILARRKGFFGGTKIFWERRLRCLNKSNL